MSSHAHPTQPDGGADRRPLDDGVLTIDCDRCTMRGIGCADCVVTVLLGGPPFGVELDDVELQAIDVLADAGLVPPLRMVEPADAPRHDRDLGRLIRGNRDLS